MMPERVLEDTATYTVIEATSDIPMEQQGGWRSVRTVWKAGTPDANADLLRQQAIAVSVANRAFIATAKPGTAAAQASAAYDQAKANSRAINGVIRLLLNQLDGTD